MRLVTGEPEHQLRHHRGGGEALEVQGQLGAGGRHLERGEILEIAPGSRGDLGDADPVHRQSRRAFGQSRLVP